MAEDEHIAKAGDVEANDTSGNVFDIELQASELQVKSDENFIERIEILLSTRSKDLGAETPCEQSLSSATPSVSSTTLDETSKAGDNVDVEKQGQASMPPIPAHQEQLACSSHENLDLDSTSDISSTHHPIQPRSPSPIVEDLDVAPTALSEILPNTSVFIVGERTRRKAPVKVRIAVVSQQLGNPKEFAGVIAGLVDLNMVLVDRFYVRLAGKRMANARIGWIDRMTNEEVDFSRWSEVSKLATLHCSSVLAGLIRASESHCTIIDDALEHFNVTETGFHLCVRGNPPTSLIDQLAKLLDISIRGKSSFSQFY